MRALIAALAAGLLATALSPLTTFAQTTNGQIIARLLESATASLGKVVDNQGILDLPVPGGSVFFLALLAPGVANTASPNNLYGPNEMGPPAGVAVAGTRANSTEFTIDGNPIMSNGGLTFNPPPEMVQEFQVQTAAYDASLGRFAGAHINLVMKTGANAIHGSAAYSNLSSGTRVRARQVQLALKLLF